MRTQGWQGAGPGRPLKPCGTEAAYRRHLQRGEDVDEKCAQGHRERNARVQNARRAKSRVVQSTRPRLPKHAGYALGELHRNGACHGAVPDLFDLVGSEPTVLHRQAAEENCARCPLIQACADYADRHGCVGVWGGSYRTGTAQGFRSLIEGAPEHRLP